MKTSNYKDKEKLLVEVASDQAGYFTAKQAIKVGYSYRLQHYHKSKGNWVEVDRGVFRLANYPNSDREDFVRWSLWSRNRNDIPQAVISHETALSFYDLGDVMPAKIHLTVPPSFKKKAPGGCVLHVKNLRDDEIEKSQGFFVTKALRTIIDVAEGHLELSHLEKAVRDAVTRGFIMLTNIQNSIMSEETKEKFRIIIDNIKKYPF